MTEPAAPQPLREPIALTLDPKRLALVADLYELTMAAAYWSAGLAERSATFELFFRELPHERSFMVAAGLEQGLHYLLHREFTDDDVQYLSRLPVFRHVSRGWFDWLRTLRFTGDVWAIPEGTVVFPGEPLMRVTAPVIEAQIVETYLLTSLAYQTSVATKAARVVAAAGGRSVVDFGSRRAHGPQAGLWAARASFIGGCVGTSNVAAAEQLGIPPVGTMAHSWVMALNDERAAFEKFAAVFPDQATFLIDTYDSIEGARNAVRCGRRPAAVRLDSGDLATLATQVRGVLDDAGWHEVKVFASGDLNEYKIDALVRGSAPIDAFGVGTELVTVADAPSLGCVYKLVEFDGPDAPAGRIKLSSGKRTYPGRKQVFRVSRPNSTFERDVIGLAHEDLPGERLLEQVMAGGQLIAALPQLARLQDRCNRQVARLPDVLRSLPRRAAFAVTMSAALEAAYDRLAAQRRPESH